MDAPIHQPAGLSPLQMIMNREAVISARLYEEKEKAERNENRIAELKVELETARQDCIAQRALEIRLAELKVQENIAATQLVLRDIEKLRIELAARERRGIEHRNDPSWGMFLQPVLAPRLCPILQW